MKRKSWTLSALAIVLSVALILPFSLKPISSVLAGEPYLKYNELTDHQQLIWDYYESMVNHDWDTHQATICPDMREADRAYVEDPYNEENHLGLFNLKSVRILEINQADSGKYSYLRDHDEPGSEQPMEVYLVGAECETYEDTDFSFTGINYTLVSLVEIDGQWYVREDCVAPLSAMEDEGNELLTREAIRRTEQRRMDISHRNLLEDQPALRARATPAALKTLSDTAEEKENVAPLTSVNTVATAAATTAATTTTETTAETTSSATVSEWSSNRSLKDDIASALTDETMSITEAESSGPAGDDSIDAVESSVTTTGEATPVVDITVSSETAQSSETSQETVQEIEQHAAATADGPPTVSPVSPIQPNVIAVVLPYRGNVVETVDFTEYIARSLSLEYPARSINGYDDADVQEGRLAIAVAIKMYAWYLLIYPRHRPYNANVCDETHCQAYQDSYHIAYQDIPYHVRSAVISVCNDGIRNSNGDIFPTQYRAGEFNRDRNPDGEGRLYQNGAVYLASQGESYLCILDYYYSYTSDSPGPICFFNVAH